MATNQRDARKRLTIDISPDEHRRLKIAAADKGVSMRDLVLQLLRTEVFAEG